MTPALARVRAARQSLALTRHALRDLPDTLVTQLTYWQRQELENAKEALKETQR